jgi:hypothetical protein
MREYTRTETAIANLPYAFMLVIGAAIIAVVFEISAGALAGAVAYAAYGIGGVVWIMVFICRYCGYYGTRSCPCGYGMLAAKLARKGGQECFARKFKRHIPVIVPLWLIPVACAAVQLAREFAAGVAWLLAAFVINSFVLLPLLSRRHACSECPQKETCPWMGRGGVAS